jgi:acetyl esterase/lipase
VTSKAELYLKKAEDFAAKAVEAGSPDTRISYEKLSHSYRQLAGHVSQSAPASDEEIEALVRRILNK